jgi:hypothetical protein
VDEGASVKTLSRSFAGGEITPELYGRLDLNKRQTGLARAYNVDILPHGPAARRPGFEYVLECKDSLNDVRLFPFEFSVDQSLVIEAGHLYFRFHTPAGTVLEASKALAGVTLATPAVFNVAGHGWSAGDWVFIANMLGLTTLNGTFYKVGTVVDADNIQLTRLDGTVISTLSLPAYTGSGTLSRVYTLTTPYPGDTVNTALFGIHYTQSNDVFTIVHPTYAARELKRLGAANWTLTTISFAPGVPAPTGVTATATVAVATNLTNQKYVATAIGADGISESLASTSSTCTNNLTLAGNFNTITWSAVGDATYYRTYKLRGGTYGYIGRTTTLSIIDDNIEADTTLVPPEDLIALNTAVDEYPSAVTYHEQRRWFAGTNKKPGGIWATRNGTGSNLTSSIPSQDADGLAFSVAARQQNRVRHLVSLADMAVLTNSSEFRIFADNAPAITPTTLTTKTSGYAGANDVQPCVTSGSVLFVQGQGSFVRELAYGGAESNYNYRTIDLSVMAPHLFTGFTLLDLAYSRAPDQRLWAVRSDGVLLGMTYLPEQQVYAWHQHQTDGLFKSVAVIGYNNNDILYAVVQRVVNGRTVKYVERRRQRVYAALADAFFVDSGLTYSGPAAATVSNLWHLEGKTVQVLAAGAVETPKVVVGGQVSIPVAATPISVGLASRAQVQLLPLALEGAEAAGQGTQKNVNSVSLRVRGSSVIKAGPSFDRLRQYDDRDVLDGYDAAPAPVDGEIDFTIDGEWGPDGTVCIEQDLPLPLNLVSVTLDVETGD